MGAGIAAYGAIYFGFHDVIVHKRIAHRYVARSPYMKRIVQAHLLHHAVETKEGAVSFGFLWAPPAEELKAELKRRERAGSGAGEIAAGSITRPVDRRRPVAAFDQRVDDEHELGRLADRVRLSQAAVPRATTLRAIAP